VDEIVVVSAVVNEFELLREGRLLQRRPFLLIQNSRGECDMEAVQGATLLLRLRLIIITPTLIISVPAQFFKCS
jgi:hypothetical protein